MDFRRITIPYKGREKYPSNGSASIRSMIANYFGGSGGGGTSGGADNRGGLASAFFAFLSKTSNVYSGLDLAQGSLNDYIQIMGYKNQDRAQTLIGNIAESAATANYGILGVPASGMVVNVINNGTTGATINLVISNTISEDSGTLVIPVAINISDNSLDPYHAVWYENSNKCVQMNLEFSWTVNRSSSSSYVMDLSNQTAQVNCDSGGTLYPNSIATLHCTATTYYDGAPATGITYSAKTESAYAATGFSINQNTGVMTFNSGGTRFNWATAYPSLPIDIIAYKDGVAIATKTMTISRNYPGTDGTPAHTRYIVTDHDVIYYDPNTSAFTPNKVVGKVMLQIGDQLPVYDSSTTIYQWYNDYGEASGVSAQGSITANTYAGITSITFGLKNGNGEFYEMEDVLVISGGLNGQPGESGATGSSGESAWYLTLSNDNASINCDASGTILDNAIRPTCKAKLYYGKTQVTTGITYNVNYGGASGVSRSTSGGILTLNFGTGFTFTGTSVEITISASTESTLRDVKVMNITKSYPGENGEDAVSYWLVPNFGEVIYNPNTHTPDPQTGVTCSAYKQIGQGAVLPAADGVIVYQYQSRTTGEFSQPPQTGSTASSSSGICESNKRIRFTLYVGAEQKDQEDVDILMDGTNGTNGQGRTGAAIRGPYDWETHSGSTQCWCAGESGSSCSECEKWIDVIVKDGTYYYCNTTYYGSLSPWNSVKSNWTSGDTFDFVAANLILAPNASIDFLTGNEIYLRDGNGHITAGLAGGNGINFWAGAIAPGDAPFTISNDGTMVATQGTFGPFTIGTDTAGESALEGIVTASTYDGNETYETYINPQNIYFRGQLSGTTSTYEETVSIAPKRDTDKYDGNGTIEVEFKETTSGTCGEMYKQYEERNAFYTNGNLVAHRYLGQTRSHQINSQGGQAVISPILGVEITFMTSDSTLFKKYGTWFINNIDTGISAAEPQSLFIKKRLRDTELNEYDVWYFDGKALASEYGICIPSAATYTFTTGGTQTWHFNGVPLGIATSAYANVGARQSTSSFGDDFDTGYWMLYNSGGGYLNTGIAHPNYLTKRNNVIYIEV